MKLTIEQVIEIAKALTSGLKVFINVDTTEIKTIGDWEIDNNFNEEKWKDILEEIESHPDKYVEIERLPPNELLAVMEGFADTVEDEDLKKQLELALSISNPIIKFKEIIKNTPDLKAKWQSYKQESYIDWIRTQLHHFNLSQKKSI